MKHIVGVADMIVSADPEDEIVTHALGSCLGITVYDPVARVGGMLHVMLPLSSVNVERAKSNPHMFIDTGVPRLFIESYKLGAEKKRLIVKVAGGASLHGHNEDDDYFQIGKRNFVMLRKLLWKNGVLLQASEVGGRESRAMTMDMATGETTIKVNGVTRSL